MTIRQRTIWFWCSALAFDASPHSCSGAMSAVSVFLCTDNWQWLLLPDYLIQERLSGIYQGCADTVGLSSGVSFCSRWTNVESQSKEFERNRNINFQSSKTRCLFTIDCNSNKESKRELNICTSLVYQGLEKRLWQVCIRWNHTVLLQPEFLHKTAHPRLSDSHKGVWFQNQSHRLVLQNNSWSSQQLIHHTVGNFHQWKKTCISPS
jgi:hypothetical protein